MGYLSEPSRFYNPNANMFKDIPPPPPLPEYDPAEEAPMWYWMKACRMEPVERTKEWSKLGDVPKNPDDPDWRGVIRSQIREYPLPEPYRLDDLTDKPKYYYFDTPDYADPFKKLIYASKFFFKTGGFMASLVAVIQGDVPSLSTVMRHTSKILIPWYAAGMAASATVITVANLRGKKDDYYNYTAGGAVAALVLGRKCCLHWIRATILCIPAALLVKYVNEHNLALYPQYNFRAKSWGLSGMNAENGILSGDLRFGYRNLRTGDPGRDVRITKS